MTRLISPGELVYFVTLFFIANYHQGVVVSFVEKHWVMYCTEVPVKLFDLYREDLVAGSTIFFSWLDSALPCSRGLLRYWRHDFSDTPPVTVVSRPLYR